MTKKTYDVNNQFVGPSKDGSFRSMSCALFIFFALCVIIILAAYPWKFHHTTYHHYEKDKYSDSYTGSKYKYHDSSTTENNENVEIIDNRQYGQRHPAKIIEEQSTTSPQSQDVTTKMIIINTSTLKSFQNDSVTDVNVIIATETTATTGSTLTSNVTDKKNKSANNDVILIETTTMREITTTALEAEETKLNGSKLTTENTMINDTMETLSTITEITTEYTMTTETDSISSSAEETTTENQSFTTNIPISTISDESTTLINSSTTADYDQSETTTEYLEGTTLNNNNPNSDTTTIISVDDQSETTTEYFEDTTLNNESPTTVISDTTNESTKISIDKNDRTETTTEYFETTTLNNDNGTTIFSVLHNNTTKIFINKNDRPETTTENFEATTTLNNDNGTTVISYSTNESNKISINKNDHPETTTEYFETTTLSTDNITTIFSDTNNNSTKIPIDKYNQIKTTTEYFEITTSTNDTNKYPAHTSDQPETTVLNNESILSSNTDVTTKYFKSDKTTQPPKQTYITEQEDIPEGIYTEHSEDDHYSSPKSHMDNENFCSTPSCKTFASDMLAQMDHAEEACEDFYNFACGRYHDDSNNNELWNMLENKLYEIDGNSLESYKLFKNYYDSCLDFHSFHTDYEERVTIVKEILKSVGRPLLSEDQTNVKTKESDLTELLAKMILLDYTPIFDVTMDLAKKGKSFVFKLSLGQSNTILQQENDKKKVQKKCMREIRKEIANSYLINLNVLYDKYLYCMQNDSLYLHNIEQSNKALHLFPQEEMDSLLANVSFVFAKFKDLPKPAFIRNEIITKKYVIRKVSELNLHFPMIKWDVLLSKLIGKPVDNEELVQVYFEDFLKSFFSKASSKRDLYNVLLAMFANQLYSTFVLPQISSPEKMCLQQTSNLLKEIVYNIYYKEKKNNVEKNKFIINKIFDTIINEFRKAISGAPWLIDDPKTRNFITTKISKIKLVTDLNVWENDSSFNNRITNLIHSSNRNYPQFTLKLVTRYRTLMYNLLQQNGTNSEYIWWNYQSPNSKKYISIYPLNGIVLPPEVLLQTIPEEIPGYLSLVKIGYNLAKAMGHHFDTTGIQYDMRIQPSVQNAYKQLAICSSTKFDMLIHYIFDGKNITYQMNETLLLSLNNRIAEDFSLKLISDMSHIFVADKSVAYLTDTFSREKIFLISIAQEHCTKLTMEELMIQLFENEELPAPILLKMIFSNLDAFKETFLCKDGSAMYHPISCPAFQDLEEEPEDYA